jgi:hypothetical protein
LNRIELANSALQSVRRKGTYLEIGVNLGDTLRRIDARTKIAVDPVFGSWRRLFASRFRSRKVVFASWKLLFASRFASVKAALPIRARQYAFSTTSDAFFARHMGLLRRFPVTVALIDGLHTAEQAYRDVVNTVAVLDSPGVVLVHDCNPVSAAAASPTFTTGKWNGEVWKAIVRLRAERTDLRVTVLDCDQGLGVVSLGQPDSVLDLDAAAVATLTYHDLEHDRQHLLNLQPPTAADAVLHEALTSPPSSSQRRRRASPRPER